MTPAFSATLNPGCSEDTAPDVPCDCSLPCERREAEPAPPSTSERLLTATAASWRSGSETKHDVSGSVQFTVPGTPIAKGRPRISTAGKFPRAYTPERTVKYENLVRLVAAETMAECGQALFDGPVCVEITALFPIAQSWSRVKREAAACGLLSHTSRPDADNIAKAITDSCNGIVWNDDSQVARLAVEKRYGAEPMTLVWVRSLP